jgi:hypothetical protein
VSSDDDGALVFNGEDRQYVDGYECTITVASDQFDKLRRDADEIMARGERSWLDDHGIERRFSSY